MQFKVKRSEHHEFADKVYAAMETGNTNTARTLMKVYKDEYPEKAAKLAQAIIKDYGVSL